MTTSITNEIYQVLLKTETKLGQKVSPHQSTRKIKTKPIKAATLVRIVKEGNVARLKQLAEERPEIKLSACWYRTLAKTAVDINHMEMLRYLYKEGARALPRDNYDCVFAKAITNGNVEMLEFLWGKGDINWHKMGEYNSYLFGEVTKWPAVTQWVINKMGIDGGIGDLIIDKDGEVDQSQKEFFTGESLDWVRDLYHLSLTNPEQFPIEKITAELNSCALIKKVYPKLGTKAIVALWEELVDKENIEQLRQSVKNGLRPTIQELIEIWYSAERYGKTVSLAWLSAAPKLVERVKQSWPDSGKKHSQGYGHKEYTVENLRLLNSLGIDLLARSKEDNGLWLARKASGLRRDVITWLAKNKPEAFATPLVKYSLTGPTIKDRMVEKDKIFTERAILKGQLVSRQKPLRVKARTKIRI